MTTSVLVVDDERTLARNIQTFLSRHGFTVTCAETGHEAIRTLEAKPADVVLLDLRLPDVDGVELLPRLLSLCPEAKVVMITAHATISTAVEAMRRGAVDYLAKPFALRDLEALLQKLQRTEIPAPPALGERQGLDAIIGRSPAIQDLKQKIGRLLHAEAESRTIAPAVLVIGETGSGKELVARAFHVDGARSGGPFIELNCSTLPAQLVEDELFGHERGAFTDAKDQKLGLIEAANGGTLFLDEIGELELATQAKLLKVLEDRKVRRLGSIREQSVDVRIVAATHQPLEELVRVGRFRADLYFRLRVVVLEVPPLRERGEDILLLARKFLEESGKRWRRPHLSFTAAGEMALMSHPWPGNVRELRNAIEQATLLSGVDALGPKELALTTISTARPRQSVLLDESQGMEEMERQLLREALDHTRGNVTAAAKLLKITRDTLRYRMQKHGLDR